MAAEEKKQEDGQKTLVAFIVGLLIGGMLVWAFSGPEAKAPVDEEVSETAQEQTLEDDNSNTATAESQTAETEQKKENTESASQSQTLKVGDGKVVVSDQSAGTAVKMDEAVYPISEGWIGVREYNNDKLGFILGVVRFSESQGLVPSEIILQRATTPGNKYAVVIFSENGDREFSLADDVQIDQIFDTFTAK